MSALTQFNVAPREYKKFCKESDSNPVVRRGTYNNVQAVIKIFPTHLVDEAKNECKVYSALQTLKDARIPRILSWRIEKKGAYMVIEVNIA